MRLLQDRVRVAKSGIFRHANASRESESAEWESFPIGLRSTRKLLQFHRLGNTDESVLHEYARGANARALSDALPDGRSAPCAALMKRRSMAREHSQLRASRSM